MHYAERGNVTADMPLIKYKDNVNPPNAPKKMPKTTHAYHKKSKIEGI